MPDVHPSFIGGSGLWARSRWALTSTGARASRVPGRLPRPGPRSAWAGPLTGELPTAAPRAARWEVYQYRHASLLKSRHGAKVIRLPGGCRCAGDMTRTIGGITVEAERQPIGPAPVPRLRAVRSALPGPGRFWLYLILASTPLLAVSGEVFGVVSLRAVSMLVLFPLLAALAVLVVLRPLAIDRTARTGFAWGLVACAGYDCFRLPTIYVFHLWGDFFGTIGGWATGTNSDYLAGYLWRYLGDGAGIGVVVFLQAAALGVSCWPRRYVIASAIAFAVLPVWTGLVLTDALAPAGRALFPLTPATLTLSLIGHLIYGAILGYGLSASQRPQPDPPRAIPRPAQALAASRTPAGHRM